MTFVWMLVYLVLGVLCVGLAHERGVAKGRRNPAVRVTLSDRLKPETRETLRRFVEHEYCGASWYGGGSPMETLVAVQSIARSYLEADAATGELGPLPQDWPRYSIRETEQ